MKTLVLYDSQTGNTDKVAQTIYKTLSHLEPAPQICKVAAGVEADILDYDLVFIGSPIIDWLPTRSMMTYVKSAMKTYTDQKRVKLSCPKLPGKFAVCFCTYGGPHIGEREAIPATMWLRSFVEHLGFTTLGLWHIPGQFGSHPKAELLNTQGRLGDVTGRPNESDLKAVSGRVTGLLKSIHPWV